MDSSFLRLSEAADADEVPLNQAWPREKNDEKKRTRQEEPNVL